MKPDNNDKNTNQTENKDLNSQNEMSKDELSQIDGGASPEDFANLNADNQREGENFKLFQEAIATEVKAFGEGI